MSRLLQSFKKLTSKKMVIGVLAVPVFALAMLAVPAGSLGVFSPSTAQASCGYWYKSDANHIVSYNYNCTWYFEHNGWNGGTVFLKDANGTPYALLSRG